MEITHFDIECNFTDYKVALYPEKAEIWVVKTNRNGKYLQSIKHNSSTFKRVLRTAVRFADIGSLAQEQYAQCADTNKIK